MSDKLGERAIVVGAGISGLLAARVLVERYDQVILLERDSFPSPGENRRGVPQGRHTHALLARGREVLDELFPGLSEELVGLGALSYDNLADIRRFIGGGYYRQARNGLTSVAVSRPLLEAQIRTRLLEHANLRVIERCDVLGLAASEDRTRITGVRMIQREPGSAEEVCAADLVVDASGRGSRAPAWLEALGYVAPTEERVEIGVGYATRIFRRKPEQLDGDLGAIVLPMGAGRRGAVSVAQEGMRWTVTLVGYAGDAPPTDDAGFLEFSRSLPTPDVYELIRNAEPLGEPVGARFPVNLRRHYERLERFPDGFLVTGDALCSFNPVYAQGMTVAALETLALRHCLRRGTRALAARFFAAATAEVNAVWRLTVGGDRRLVAPKEHRSAPARLLGWYLTKLHAAAHHDSVPALAFLRVAGLVDRPSSLLRPALVARVLWINLRGMSRPARPLRTVRGFA